MVAWRRGLMMHRVWGNNIVQYLDTFWLISEEMGRPIQTKKAISLTNWLAPLLLRSTSSSNEVSNLSSRQIRNQSVLRGTGFRQCPGSLDTRKAMYLKRKTGLPSSHSDEYSRLLK